MTLDADDIDAIARRVAELLREEQPSPGAMIDAKAKARQLSMALDDLYRHAGDLGGVKIGGRWRFPQEPPKQPAPAPSPVTRRHRTKVGRVPLLPVRG